MENTEILSTLIEIIRDEFEDDSLQIDEHTSSEDFDMWDSLAHINLVEAVQREFDIRFRGEDLESLKTVGDFISAVRSKI